MNRIVFVLLIVVSLTGVQAKKALGGDYVFHSFPLQDTLVAGMDNELYLTLDGKTVSGLVVTGMEANVRYRGEGKYVVNGCTAGHTALIIVANSGDLFLQRPFVVVELTEALKTRIAALTKERQTGQAGTAPVENGPEYTVKITPLQDTLLPGFDNTLQVYVDGQPNTEINGISISVSGATLAPAGKRGVYLLKPLESSGKPSVAQFDMTKNDKLVLSKDLVIPVMTPELKARAEAAIAAQKTK